MFAARVLCWVLGAILLAYGVACLIDPAFITGPSGIEASGGARTELRATYGGIQIGFGLFCLWGGRGGAALPPVLLAIALVFGAVAGARGLGLWLDAVPGTFHVAALGFEVVSCALALLALRAARARPHLISPGRSG